MNITIDKNTLQKALTFASHGMPTKATDPILENIHIKAEDGKLRLLSTSLDLTAAAYTAADTQENGEILLPGASFTKLVKAFSAKPVEIQMDEGSSTVKVKCGSYKGSFASADPKRFPVILELPDSPVATFDRLAFLESLQAIEFAVCHDPVRPALNAVQITPESMAATNGKVSAIYRYSFDLSPDPENPDEIPEVCIASGVIDELIKVLRESDSADVVLYEKDAYLIFVLGENRFYARKIDIKFPPVSTFHDERAAAGNNQSVTFTTDSLKSALKRTSVTTEGFIELTPEENGMKMNLSANTKNSSASEELDCTSSNLTVPNIGYDSRLLLDVLSHLSGSEVTITLSEDIRIPTRIEEGILTLLLMRSISGENA